MLANGAKLGFAEAGGSTFTDLPGLKEIPDLGNNPERVENTCLTDTVKQYEMGIGDPGETVYKFRYDNTSPDSPYRILREMEESGKVYNWQETTKDGTKTAFSGQCAVTRTGGGVNGVIEFNLTIYLQGAFVITDPA